jgi:hypothetical protein
VAAGCGVALVLGVVGMGAVGYGLFRWGKQIESDIKDPATRTAKVKAVLGADTLPDGYHPVVGLSIPFVMEMAMLSDREPDLEGHGRGLGQRGFLYFHYVSVSPDEKALRDYFEGRTSDDSALRRAGVNFRFKDQEVIRRGVVQTSGHPVLYLAQRGELEMDDDHRRGVNSLLLVDCPQDDRMRMGIWFGPDPDPGTPAATANLQGSPADEKALTAFLAHFHLCREAQ